MFWDRYRLVFKVHPLLCFLIVLKGDLQKTSNFEIQYLVKRVISIKSYYDAQCKTLLSVFKGIK